MVLGVLLTGVSHFFVGAPYVPTPARIMDQMFALARLKGAEVIYDLGAGDARFLIEAKRRYPGIVAKGCEIVPTIWLLGRLRIWWSGQYVRLTRDNALAMDVADADVIFLYLTPPLMSKLLPSFRRTLRPGTIVVTHAFALPGLEPEETVQVRAWRRTKTLYRYRF